MCRQSPCSCLNCTHVKRSVQVPTSGECLKSVQEACFLPALEPSCDPLPHAAGCCRHPRALGWLLAAETELLPVRSAGALREPCSPSKNWSRVVVGRCPNTAPAGRKALPVGCRPLGQRPCCWDLLPWQPSAHYTRLHGLIDANCGLRCKSGRTGGLMHTLGLSSHDPSLCRWVWELLPRTESATSRRGHANSGLVIA